MVKLVPTFSPILILSAIEVKIIGLSAVPTAFNLPPLATISADANDPEPSFPLIMVPASMVSVTPSLTTTFPFKIQILLAVQVVFAVINPETFSSVAAGGVTSIIGAVPPPVEQEVKTELARIKR